MLGNTTWRSDTSFSDLDQTFMHVVDSCIYFDSEKLHFMLVPSLLLLQFLIIKKIRTEKMIFESS